MSIDTPNASGILDRPIARPRHSIVSRAILACATVIFFTLLGILGNMYMTEALEGDAEAINVAGSLRMQAWRLAAKADSEAAQLQAEIGLLDATLQSSVLQAALKRHGASTLPEQQAAVVQQWQDTMRPLLATADPLTPRATQAFRAQVPVFVGLLDGIVSSLQRLSERNLAMIHGFQLGTLLIVLLSTCLLIFDLRRHLARPLRQLTTLAHQVSRGDFSGRITPGSGTELDLLASTLNKMNEELAGLYADMESKVNDKTAELTRSNAALHLLFDSARMLYNQPDDPVSMMALSLAGVRKALGCGPVSLCLNSGAGAGNYTAITSEGSAPPHYCSLSSRAECPADLTGSDLELTSFKLHAGHTHLGSLRVEQPAGKPLQAWQEQVLVTLADLYAASLSLANLGQHQARLALMEERAVIARELHDSLAQSLSAQKLQLARLKRQVELGCGPEELAQTREQIEQGLSAAYRQLRELLTTFRIQVNEPGLKPALQATVKEFSRNSGVEVSLDYRLDHCPLSPNEEVHCLQITREAMSNVIKHAQASHCWITLRQDDKGIVSLSIEDDGIGISDIKSPEGHYGLSILRERASSLGGSLQIGRRMDLGTQILAQFPPAYRTADPKQEHAVYD